MNGFSYKLVKRLGKAKAGVITTGHGKVETPVFMPVGTHGAVKSLTPDDLVFLGAEIILSNTYHLYLRPGDKLIKKFGGLHKFMKWKKPILTDSGGYQVSSLGHFIDDMEQGERRIKKSIIDDEGVTFTSHLDGSRHRFTPEKAIEIQENLGADIIMAFDEATPVKGKKYAKEAMERTHKWLDRCISRWKSTIQNPALFGIIQGGDYRDLRRISAEYVVSRNLPGIAIGGASIGKDAKQTAENVDWVRDLLPSDKPLYLMGVGVNPEDVISAVESGADMIDCVAPTRLARMGQLYSGKLKGKKKWVFESEFRKGRMNISNRRFKSDKKPIEDKCDCYTCKQGFSRAYLHHLFKIRELTYFRLATIHNVRFMVRLMNELREVIVDNKTSLK